MTDQPTLITLKELCLSMVGQRITFPAKFRLVRSKAIFSEALTVCSHCGQILGSRDLRSDPQLFYDAVVGNLAKYDRKNKQPDGHRTSVSLNKEGEMFRYIDVFISDAATPTVEIAGCIIQDSIPDFSIGQLTCLVCWGAKSKRFELVAYNLKPLPASPANGVLK